MRRGTRVQRLDRVHVIQAEELAGSDPIAEDGRPAPAVVLKEESRTAVRFVRERPYFPVDFADGVGRRRMEHRVW